MDRRSVVRRKMLLMLCFSGATILAGCASGSSSSSSPATSRNVLTAEDLMSVSGGNVYRALEQLRPLWLTSRSGRSVNVPTEIAVIIDGTYFGPVDSLRQISVTTVNEIRYLGSSEATAAVPGLSRSTHVEAAIWLQLGGRE